MFDWQVIQVPSNELDQTMFLSKNKKWGTLSYHMHCKQNKKIQNVLKIEIHTFPSSFSRILDIPKS
jgi:hypothetical protein